MLAVSQGLESGINVDSDAGRDIKLELDRRSEEKILNVLMAKTPFDVLSEESNIKRRGGSSDLVWIIDPIDGSSNLKRGFPFYAVSISLWEGLERPRLGVVVDIPRNCLYTGLAGDGAFANGERICVSQVGDRSKATLTTGLPVYRSFESEALVQFASRLALYKKIRMIGSAALSLALVASGVVDAYEEEDIAIWDVAAGIALVLEAGGKCETTRGRGEFLLNVRATNGRI